MVLRVSLSSPLQVFLVAVCSCACCCVRVWITNADAGRARRGFKVVWSEAFIFQYASPRPLSVLSACEVRRRQPRECDLAAWLSLRITAPGALRA